MNPHAVLPNATLSFAAAEHRSLAWIRNLFARVRHALLRERTRRELRRLTDHELRDIGLVRGDIDSVVRTLQRP